MRSKIENSEYNFLNRIYNEKKRLCYRAVRSRVSGTNGSTGWPYDGVEFMEHLCAGY